MATPQDLLSALARAHSLTETRVGDDPEFVEAIENVREIQEAVGWLAVSVQPEGLYARGEVIPDVYAEFGQLMVALEDAGIQELRLQEVMEPAVLEDFLRRLHPSSAPEGTLPSARFRGLEGELGISFREVQPTLPGMVGAVQDLFQTPVSPLRDPAGVAAGRSSAASVPTEESYSPGRVLSAELVEEVSKYFDGDGLLRAESEKRLRDGAAGLTKTRDVAALSELVQLLAESAGSDSGGREALELVRELTTPAVASNIVARLGAARDENERVRLTNVISRIGREGALALADALGEARDRSERRSFLDAMVTQGPLALEMAERMVGDPRWFVVRNGVTVLGELGGEDAVTHLTSTLANGDSRVRKETILSLSKVGGPDAETLLLGMLDDGEPGVRATACRALGALRSNRAYRPLLKLLKADDHGVQVECLQALGRIGDPGAVPLIEKKAVGGLLSRQPPEIRIAAFRALASIGTARAVRTLEKGAKDRDSDVQTAVRALIGKG